MTSVIKKSLYFILGFCFILPIINNSANAQIVRTLLTVSDSECAGGLRPSARQIDRLLIEVQKINIRSGGTRTRECDALRHIGLSGGLSGADVCGPRYESCTPQSFRRADRQPLTQKDIQNINNIFNEIGIRAITRPFDQSYSLSCRTT